MELNINNQINTAEKLIHVNAKDPSKFITIAQSVKRKGAHFFLKRTFDILVSLMLVLLFAPILIIVTLLIKLTSRGPVLYSKERVGLNGRYFKCHKFRSMVIDHSGQRYDHKSSIEHATKGILHKNQRDSRITFVGRMIRKTSIDELPQLFNVLFGDMSIVGPRPLLPFMLEPYPEFSQVRCLVRPGITGLWQIRDRQNNTSAQYMMEHDMEYIENFNFFLDLKIIAETPLVVLSGKGAY
ncbi:MAG TPA: sugar transferase [Parafilimonas sp.]|nr:sugar transferase [Parafilimonas sp.]